MKEMSTPNESKWQEPDMVVASREFEVTPNVMQRLDDLSNTLEQLGSVIGLLQERLTPVLRWRYERDRTGRPAVQSVDPHGPEATTAVPAMGPALNRIDILEGHTRQIINDVNATLQMLELP